jgi:hypothetical protein
MSLGFDVLLLLGIGGFWLIKRHKQPRQPPRRFAPPPYKNRWTPPPASGTDQSPHASSARAEPEWVIERRKRAQVAGQAGEKLVREKLHELQLVALHDIMLADEVGLTQVDHVVKTPWGIAVIETKYYTGFIYRSRVRHQWTQRLNRGDEVFEYNFQNPNRQNYGHVKAVKHVIGPSAAIPVKGFVMFVGDAKIGDSIKDDVLPIEQLGETLWGLRGPRADSSNLEAAWDRLQQAAQRTEGRREEHRQMLKNRYSQADESIPF